MGDDMMCAYIFWDAIFIYIYICIIYIYIHNSRIFMNILDICAEITYHRNPYKLLGGSPDLVMGESFGSKQQLCWLCWTCKPKRSDFVERENNAGKPTSWTLVSFEMVSFPLSSF